MKAIDIDWDYGEYTDEDILLPTEVEIPENISEDEVSDYLSDLTGFCHRSYVLEKPRRLYGVKLIMSDEHTIKATSPEEAELMARAKFGSSYLIEDVIVEEF